MEELMRRSTGLDDVEGEAALELHAGGTEDGAQGARGSTLLADHLADVASRDMEAKDGGFLFGEDLDANSVRVVHQCTGNFSQQELHFRHSKTAVQRVRCLGHTYTSRGYRERTSHYRRLNSKWKRSFGNTLCRWRTIGQKNFK